MKATHAGRQLSLVRREQNNSTFFYAFYIQGKRYSTAGYQLPLGAKATETRENLAKSLRAIAALPTEKERLAAINKTANVRWTK